MTRADPIRVLLVDDHLMVRRGLAAMLSAYDDFALVGEAGDGEEAVRLCEQLRPDVVLMDLLLPGMDGATATAAIRRRYPAIQVIALTSFREDDLLRRVVQAGAIGYLLKNAGAEELAAAIRAARAGQPTLAPEALPVLFHTVAHPAASGSELTEREREVLALLVRGMSNTAIAEQLVLSTRTVRGHVSNILAKLGVASRTEAVALAVQHHLVNGPC
jgi:NarL family two-component system response regulator LiaR